MLGTWGGRRTWLQQHGVDFEFLYAGAVPDNLDGGIKRGSVYEGVLLMMMTLDSEKLGLYKDGTFRASSFWLHSGPAFSRNYVGDLNQVSLLDFPDSLRLWELWYEQKLFKQKLAIKAGQLDIGQDFIVPEYYNSLGSVNFLNQTFFYPTMAFNVYDQRYFPVGHHGLASTPYAAPGVRLRYDPIPQFYGQFGAYDGNPDRTSPGTRINLNEDEGALLYFEIGYRHNQEKNSEGLPGSLKLGGWYHTDDFFDQYDATFVAFDNFAIANGGSPLGLVTNPRQHSGNYGAYFLADHVLWRENGKDDPAMQGLAGFFRAAGAPKDRNLAQFGVDGGLVYRGLIPSRDWDTIGVAASYLEISDDLRRAQKGISAALDGLSPGLGSIVPRADYETVLEINYKAQLTAWWSVSASFQRVFHPGGRIAANIPDASVFIVQALFRF
jgi:porin